MEIVFYAILAIIAIAGLIVFIASRKPDTFRCERRTLIKAPPAAIYTHLVDLTLWHQWSPWAKKDPNMRMEFSEPTSGIGAWQRWDGNGQVGSGKMIISADEPAQRIEYRLEFLTPFTATNFAELVLTPKGDDTEVVWAMHGPAPLISKVMDLLMNMDKMIGNDFETGLTDLKAICESKPARLDASS
jgi:uncharacterized protein YndB with AHSA1/START domain